jgi:hypothetical protein
MAAKVRSATAPLRCAQFGHIAHADEDLIIKLPTNLKSLFHPISFLRLVCAKHQAER